MKLPQEFDLHSLEVFLLTVELGGMSQCAGHLQVTQSAVSQTIAKLETRLGTILFDRALRPLGLTASGKSLFERGHRLITLAKLTYDEVREGADLPIAGITVAMSESLANQLTSPLLTALGPRAERWSIRSGISLEQHSAFLARDIDMLVTGSSSLEHRANIEVHPVFEECFVLIFPGDYKGPVDLSVLPPIPFIRYSHHSAMGQKIERQIVRMKLKLPHRIEIDSTHQQLTAVAAGIGWSITSPLCLAGHPEWLDRLRIEPMHRARFSRQIKVIARSRELGDLPREAADLARTSLREKTFPPLIARYPWLADQLVWPAA